MLADFFTKPLQGSLFHRFINVLMGFEHISTLQRTIDSTSSPELKEGVEISNETSNEYLQNRIVSSVDNDKNEKERGEKRKEKDTYRTPVSNVERDVNNDVILSMGLSETTKYKEQTNHDDFGKNMYE